MNLRNLRWTHKKPAGSPADFMLPEGAGITDALLLSVAQDNELSPRDNAIFLLQSAAEIEHSLLVQYLFALFSLETGQAGTPQYRGNPPLNALKLATGWRGKIFQIAEEEMGHLITVQNVLRLLGGPLHFDRESFPYRSEFYPFRFMLRKLTRTSLAMYVCAEMPPDPPAAVLPADEMERTVKRATAGQGSGGVLINHVGTLYHAIIALLKVLDPAKDFRTDTQDWQGGSEWGAHGADFRIFPVNTRDQAVAALGSVAEQGEGFSGVHAPDGTSHFERFLAIYRAFPESEDEIGPLEWDPARPIAKNPNTTDPPRQDAARDPLVALAEAEIGPGRITNKTTRLWAQLFNIRYRLLLSYLGHALERKKVAGSLRESLRSAAIAEMFTITALADRITAMKLNPDGSVSPWQAGPPFEMPYSVALPGRESDRWRLHADLLAASAAIIAKIPGSADDTTLQDIVSGDTDAGWTATLQAEITKNRPSEDEP